MEATMIVDKSHTGLFLYETIKRPPWFADVNGDDTDNTLYGGNALFGSHIYAAGGQDTVYAGNGTDTVYGGNGDDHLYGQGGDDLLFGEAGSDLLDGGTGADRMLGGDGNDTYIVDDKGDLVTEL